MSTRSHSGPSVTTGPIQSDRSQGHQILPVMTWTSDGRKWKGRKGKGTRNRRRGIERPQAAGGHPPWADIAQGVLRDGMPDFPTSESPMTGSGVIMPWLQSCRMHAIRRKPKKKNVWFPVWFQKDFKNLILNLLLIRTPNAEPSSTCMYSECVNSL
jgi:hypothetical protein